MLLTSAVELIRAVLPGMKQRRFGRILNVTSITVKQPIDNLILSNALRAAVTGMARTLATEVAPYGITVNNLLPGYTRTERLTELAESAAGRTGATPATSSTARKRDSGEAPRRAARAGGALRVPGLGARRVRHGAVIAVDGGWIRGLF